MKRVALLVAGSVALLANACIVQDDADRFREGIPQSGDVATKVPGSSQTSGSSTTQSAGLGIRTVGGGVGQRATFYGFTREITDSVDYHTGAVLGVVWAIVHSSPTKIEAKRAVWGPGNGNALHPAVWRFTATEVGDKEYDYVLEGRPKASTSEADYKTVLHGHGYGNAHPQHRQGWFQWDADAINALDPGQSKDSGTAKVSYDLKQIPATIGVELRPTDTQSWIDVKVTHQSGGAGQVDINGLADFDSAKNTQLENIVLHSRWDGTGAGRADLDVSGGDMTGPAKIEECWSTAFARVFMSVNEQSEGTSASCAFSTPAQ